MAPGPWTHLRRASPFLGILAGHFHPGSFGVRFCTREERERTHATVSLCHCLLATPRAEAQGWRSTRILQKATDLSGLPRVYRIRGAEEAQRADHSLGQALVGSGCTKWWLRVGCTWRIEEVQHADGLGGAELLDSHGALGAQGDHELGRLRIPRGAKTPERALYCAVLYCNVLYCAVLYCPG